jgi:hypothetical protein
MKISIASLILFICLSAQAQKKTPPELYYFFGKDSLIGVKDKQGKVIIPAKFDYAYFEENDMKVEGDVILFYNSDPVERSSLAHKQFLSFYDRNGRFLLHPFMYESGPDVMEEGLRRYVENNKMGFYDRNYKTVIPARYDFAEPFEYGLAAVCVGCRLYVDSTIKDDEHNTRLSDGAWGLINQKGQVVVPLGKLDSSGRRFIDLTTAAVKRYAPFRYTEFEKGIVKKAMAVPGLKEYLRISGGEPKAKYIFEIVERPSASFPYYMLKAFSISEDIITNAYVTLAISKDGKKIFRYWQYEDQLEPVQKWIKREEEERKN